MKWWNLPDLGGRCPEQTCRSSFCRKDLSSLRTSTHWWNNDRANSRWFSYRIQYKSCQFDKFYSKNGISLSLQEIRDDTHHSIFAIAIPIHAYISGLGLLPNEALKLNIYETNDRLKQEAMSGTQRNVIFTLLCQIGWHGLSKFVKIWFSFIYSKSWEWKKIWI